MSRLNTKICIVTGAGRGIGAAIGRAFAREGATVVVTDKDEGSAADLAREIGGHHLRLDVASEADWTALAEAWPACDVLVNNAGNHGLRGSNAPARPRARLAGGLAGRTCGQSGRHISRLPLCDRRDARQGHGIDHQISSRSGIVGIPAAAAYASSKAAVRNHTKSVALYCAEQGLNIRCNSIHPAAILTPMWEPMLGDGPDREARMAAFVADTPMRRFGTVEEVASIALLLASDEAAYMTGTELTVDGGLLAGSAAAPKAD